MLGTCGQLGAAGQLIQGRAQHEDIGLVQGAEIIVQDLLWDVPAHGTRTLILAMCCTSLWTTSKDTCTLTLPLLTPPCKVRRPPMGLASLAAPLSDDLSYK